MSDLSEILAKAIHSRLQLEGPSIGKTDIIQVVIHETATTVLQDLIDHSYLDKEEVGRYISERMKVPEGN